MRLHARYIPPHLSWKGLLGTKEPQAGWFLTRFGIHTFGMHYPIDVVILDSVGIAQTIKEHLAPNRFFLWNPRYEIVVELPAGTIQKMKITKGQHVTLY